MMHVTSGSPLKQCIVISNVEHVLSNRQRLLDSFHIAHTHPLGGIDVPFGVTTFDLIIDLRLCAIVDLN